jgi:hypothetical protein
VLINRPELPPTGARESSIRPVAAALANALFYATGVRLRRAPLTPEAAQAGVGVGSIHDRSAARRGNNQRYSHLWHSGFAEA